MCIALTGVAQRLNLPPPLGPPKKRWLHRAQDRCRSMPRHWYRDMLPAHPNLRRNNPRTLCLLVPVLIKALEAPVQLGSELLCKSYTFFQQGNISAHVSRISCADDSSVDLGLIESER